MTADEATTLAVRALVDRTYEAMSTPGSAVAELFGAEDIAVTGSGQGELFSGPEEAIAAATAVSSYGLTWKAETVSVWRRGEVAWAQILGTVHVTRDGVDELVPYTTTGVFELADDQWRWVYWGGSEPQASPKV